MSSLTLTLPGRLEALFAAPLHNPDFPVRAEEVELDLERMRATPVTPRRPLLVLAGYHAWSLTVGAYARTFHSLVGGPREMFHAMAYPLGTDIQAMSRRVVDEVERRWPHAQAHRTTEIDVIGVSMGGIVARTAAHDWDDSRKRLRIARLFTLATPHRGALLAERFKLDRAARDLHPESDFLRTLNRSLATAKYDLTCYARLGDKWVGATRAAPPGREPIWVSGLRFMSHTTITSDKRILADIARRLRGEDPLAKQASAPPRD